MYNSGISKLGELVVIAEKVGVIKRSGAYYSYKDKTLGQGIEKTKQFLQTDEKLIKEIKKEIDKKIKEEK